MSSAAARCPAATPRHRSREDVARSGRRTARSLAIRRAVALAALLGTSRVAADEGFDLRWNAPASCPGRADIARRVRALVGSAAPSPLRFAATLSRTSGAAWTAALESAGGGRRSTRTFSAPSCEELAEAVAVVIAIDIDPSEGSVAEPAPSAAPSEGAVSETTRDRIGEPRLPAEASAEPGGALPPAAATRDRAGAASFDLGGLDVGARGAWMLGAFAAPSPGVTASLAWTPRVGRSREGRGPVRVEIDGSYFAPARVEPAAGVDARFGVVAGGALVCGAYSFAPWSLGLCGGAEFGRVSGRASGAAIVTPGEGSGPWVAGRAGVFGTWRWTRALALRADLGLGVPLVRYGFVVRDHGNVQAVGRVFARGGIGVEMSFR